MLQHPLVAVNTFKIDHVILYVVVGVWDEERDNYFIYLQCALADQIYLDAIAISLSP